jgi:peptidoglycan/xylan/chitin deacetylase (PgdA/CDA1 family)
MEQSQPLETIDRIPTVPLRLHRRKKPALLVLLIPCICPLLFCTVGLLTYSAEALFKGNYLFPLSVYANRSSTMLPTPTSVMITPTSTPSRVAPTNITTSMPLTPTSVMITPTSTPSRVAPTNATTSMPPTPTDVVTPTPAPPAPTPTPTPIPSQDMCNGIPLPASNVPLQIPFAHGRQDFPEVALTFDDGPNPPYTSQILAILQNYHVHATFFTVGWQIKAYPTLEQQEADQGNLVENHSWSHANFNTLTAESMNWQLTTTNDAVHKTTHIWPTLFRPPYGAYNSTLLNIATSLNLTTVTWNVDPRDWALPGTDAIISRVLSQTQNGSIILMHDGGGNRSQTVAALPTIIEQLQQRGFCLVTVQQLLDDLSPQG